MWKWSGFAIRYAPLLVSALIVLGDRITKISIQQTFSSLDAVTIIPGWLRIVHNENAGAAFGMLAEGNPIVRGLVLIGVSALVLIFVGSALFSRSDAFSAPLLRFGLGSVLGGALGNLYDRVVHGTVTDFIEVFHGDWSFPSFNVADSAITAGAVLLLIDVLRPRRRPVQPAVEMAHK